MKKIIYFTFVIAFSILIIGGCTNNQTEVEDTPQSIEEVSDYEVPKVYASFYPIWDFAQRIGGERIDLELIIPAGADPHHFEISARGLADMENADLIFLNGLEFEPWENDLRSIAQGNVISLGEYARPLPFGDDHHSHGHDHNHDHDGEDNHEHGLMDPHVWLDPNRAIDMSSALLDALISIAPSNENYYKANFEELKDELDELDRKYSALKDIENKKPIVVSHNSYGYISDTYGIEFYSISGMSAEQEPSLRVLSNIIELVREKNIEVIFFEELANEKVAQTIASETGAKTDVLYTIEGMTEEEIQSGMGYISKMNENLNKILEAIQ
ncbi:zinc transport system substrate-binding protein [Acetoanaerobium pronyense]|uniref:Zinc transport system substrate-binding protein n=1 Tax=Acetoanaerobium pronyense TaxID=1482736 RepID=A0ABS4KGA9_9FIRM|nr:zinc ABC transporter substrate-binding protein [Acetoanaerobium pronyense]MBP2026816.1 zinc transport system substrate-binding protein [Acetoanaerobium pronyense]